MLFQLKKDGFLKNNVNNSDIDITRLSVQNSLKHFTTEISKNKVLLLSVIALS